MMETYTRVPDILDLNFDNDAHFPAFPDIDLRDEDLSSLQELDIEHSFFHQVEQLKPELPAADTAAINPNSAIVPTDILHQCDMDESCDSCTSLEDCLSNAEYLAMTCSRGEKRPFTADTDDLSELDNSDKLRRDCMWSSGPGGLHKFYRPEETASPAVAMAVTAVPFLLTDDLGLTPPTSYIHQYIEQFQEVLTNSSDDVCSVSSGEDSDWSSIANESDMDQCLEVPSTPPATTITSPPAFTSLCPINDQESRNLSSGDHSYYTSMNETNFPTPPESSDDEDEATKEKLCSKTATGAAIFTGGLVNNALRLARNQNKLNTDSLRQEIQRLAQQRRSQPKFTIKVQMKAKAKYANTLKHLKGIKRSASLISSSSTSSSSSKLSMLSPSINLEKPREAKELHNYMERQRRNELRNAYEFLKKHVPSVAKSDRASKQMILDKAIEYCHTVTTKEEAMNKQRQALYEKKISLQKRIMQLQRQNSLQQ